MARGKCADSGFRGLDNGVQAAELCGLGFRVYSRV